MYKIWKCIIFIKICSVSIGIQAETLESGFRSPPEEMRPETWFHLIGGNVSKPGLTADLEAVAGAGFGGIQLFHGRGGKWPGVSPQIECLSSNWDDMIEYAADEARRLGLRFTMQNCPGWAMSGGPWITPDKAMRHLILSRQDVKGGGNVSMKLPKPQPSCQGWRDYRDIAVLAFPTSAEDDGQYLVPAEIRSNRKDLPWKDLLHGKKNTSICINPSNDLPWVEVTFLKPVHLRFIELPPVEILMLRRNFNPDTSILLQARTDRGLVDIMRRAVPRGTWQDRQPEMPLVLAYPDYQAETFRITFENKHPIRLDTMRLSSAARVHDWPGQAGYALRSLDRGMIPEQNPKAWVKSDSIVDISGYMNSNGQLRWDASAGNWTVLRFGHVNTGVKNKPAPPEATGFECDKLSPEGADQHFAGYIGKVSAPGGPADGGRLKGMLIDSWECYTQTWTPTMEKEFMQRRGYALRSWLPALAGWVIEDHITSERFLRDWRATISDLLVENYFGRLRELAKRRGMKLSFETAIGDVSPGDILQYYSKADIPMCEFWQPNDPHWGGLETKPIAPCASAAHIYGKQRIAAEAFTNIGFRWDEHPFMLKNFADFHFARGVNHLVFHTYTHNPKLDTVPGTSFGGRIGTPFLRGQTWWKYMPLFIDYLSRCQYFLGQGRPVADVLWYLGDDLDHKPRQDSPFPTGYKFDYINYDALANRIRVIDGLLQTPEGLSWKVLWLPEFDGRCRRMTPQTLECIHRLCRDGATVIGAAPLQNASLSGGIEADKRFAELISRLWGSNPGDRGNRCIGKGRLIWGYPLESVLSSLKIVPDVIGTHAASWCHRQIDTMDVYFVAADRLSPLKANICFRARGKPELWDPMTGKIKSALIYHRQKNHNVIPLDLPAAGSVFVVFRKEQDEPQYKKIMRNGAIFIDPSDLTKIDRGIPRPIYGLSQQDQIQPWIENLPAAGLFSDNGKNFVAWQDGRYEFESQNRQTVSAVVKGTRVLDLSGPWELFYPPGWDTPEMVKMPKLLGWSELKDPACKAFSGTAVYRHTVRLSSIAFKQRFLLDLGRVENIAEIIINGQPASVLWAQPYRTDITRYVKTGDNMIEIHVTNTWYNRLAYEASLPEEKHKTWSINAPKAGSPVKPAGLIGPVTIHIGKSVELEDSPCVSMKSQVVDQIEVDSVWAANRVGFALQTIGDQQFAAYYDQNRMMTVASRNISSHAWKKTALPNKLMWDSHNRVVMGIDEMGYIHVSGNMHTHPLCYFRSERPFDISNMIELNEMVGRDEKSVTYPRFFHDNQNRLLFSYRAGSCGNGNILVNRFEPGTGKWLRHFETPLFEGISGKDARAAYHRFSRDAEGGFHYVWMWRWTPDVETCHQLCYAFSPDLVQWKNIAGKKVALPFRPDNQDVIVDDVPSRGGLHNSRYQIKLTADGQPIIGYVKYDEQGHTQLYIARFLKNRWISRKISDWDFRWKFIEGGDEMSIGGRFHMLGFSEEGYLVVKWHTEKGCFGRYVLDPNTLEPVKASVELACGYPKEIYERLSDTPGLSVQIARDSGGIQQNGDRYLLKWETKGASHGRHAPAFIPDGPVSRLVVLKIH